MSRFNEVVRALSAARRVGIGSLLLLALGACPVVWGQRPIYTCTDASGKSFTSDRPIPECLARDQRVLNPDGSVKRVQPPAPTEEERNATETRDREAAAARAARQEAVRRDRSLLARFPNEAAHHKARAASLDDVSKSVRAAEARLAVLASERPPLTREAEFYVGKPIPPKLKAQLDANDASVEAQRSLLQSQRAEEARIVKLYETELERLKKLWAGAQPGSIGALAGAASASRK